MYRDRTLRFLKKGLVTAAVTMAAGLALTLAPAVSSAEEVSVSAAAPVPFVTCFVAPPAAPFYGRFEGPQIGTVFQGQGFDSYHTQFFREWWTAGILWGRPGFVWMKLRDLRC